GRNGVYLRADRVPVLALRHGDEVALTPPDQEPPLRVRFENALEDVFVPEGVATSSAWAERLAKEPPKPGTLGRYAFVDPSARAEVPGAHLAKDRETGADVLVRVLPPAPDGQAADAWFHLVAAFAGASHP